MVVCALVNNFNFVGVVQAGELGGSSDNRDQKNCNLENTIRDYYTMQVGQLVVRMRSAQNEA